MAYVEAPYAAGVTVLYVSPSTVAVMAVPALTAAPFSVTVPWNRLGIPGLMGGPGVAVITGVGGAVGGRVGATVGTGVGAGVGVSTGVGDGVGVGAGPPQQAIPTSTNDSINSGATTHANFLISLLFIIC